MRDDGDRFRKAQEKRVCYDYLYLDDYQALNALSSAAGGLEGDSQIEVTKQRGGSVALKFSLWGAGFGLNGSGSQAQRKQFVNRQTIHSQMISLFEKTKASVVDVTDDGQVSLLKEGFLVKFDGFMRPLDANQRVASQSPQPPWPDGRTWPRIRAKLGWSSPDKKERDRRRDMIGTDRFASLVHIVDTSGSLGTHYIALELTAEYAMVAQKDDFARRATVFGWVTGVSCNDLHRLALETKSSGSSEIKFRYEIQSALQSPALASSTGSDAPSQLIQEHEQARPQLRSSDNNEVDSPIKKSARRRRPRRRAHGDANTGETSKSGQSGTNNEAASRPITSVELAASIRPICIYR